MGVMTRSDGDLAALWAQQQADAQRAQVSEVSSMDRVALLYFPASEGEWFVAEARELTFVDGNYATTLLARAFAACARSERAAGSSMR